MTAGWNSEMSGRISLPSSNDKFLIPARNLRKGDLGGIIFGCKNNTMGECLSKQLFGLPGYHFPYVKNVQPGLPLFLFNYSDRKMHGIYEAASRGELNIDSYAWADDGAERSPFPAQVRINIRMQCNPLMETQFKKIIGGNYYNPQHFWFELDRAQTQGLTALFTQSLVRPTYVPVALPTPVQATRPSMASSWTDLFKAVPSTTSKEVSFQECLDPRTCEPKKSLESSVDYTSAPVDLEYTDAQQSNPCKPSPTSLEDAKQKEPVSDWEDLADEVPDVRRESACNGASQTVQGEESGNVEFKTDAEKFLLKLKMLSANRAMGCMKDSGITSAEEETNENSAHFFDELDPLVEMEERSDASDLHLGNTESVKVIRELSDRLAKLEKQQRFAPAAAEMDGVIYAVGGYNGEAYMLSAERFDPREAYWKMLPSMNVKRGCLSLVAFNEKLYAMGGFNGKEMVSSVEVFDPRMGSWTVDESMHSVRGYAASVVLGDTLFTIGGVKDGVAIVDTVECYREGRGWSDSGLKAVGERCFCSAVVL